MRRALFASLFVGVLILSACAEPTPTPVMGNRRAHTAHLNISFPADQASKVEEFLIFAEDVYADVNGLLNGSLPPTIGVTLVSEHGSRLSESGIVISLQPFANVEQTMARELVYVALGELVGHRRDRPCFGFFYEGLGAWMEEHYERKQGSAVAFHDFTSVPQITADLDVTREGQLRNVSVVVRITNMEGGRYKHCVSYKSAEDWTENCHTASSRDLKADVSLGQVPAGTRMMWDAAVWSNTVQSWIRTGWQEEIIP